MGPKGFQEMKGKKNTRSQKVNTSHTRSQLYMDISRHGKHIFDIIRIYVVSTHVKTPFELLAIGILQLTPHYVEQTRCSLFNPLHFSSITLSG
ncbi:hypothetical protein ACLKA7_014339 [Drosophila subpalustris]